MPLAVTINRNDKPKTDNYIDDATTVVVETDELNVNKAAAIVIWKCKFLENRSANITRNHILSSSRITILRP